MGTRADADAEPVKPGRPPPCDAGPGRGHIPALHNSPPSTSACHRRGGRRCYRQLRWGLAVILRPAVACGVGLVSVVVHPGCLWRQGRSVALAVETGKRSGSPHTRSVVWRKINGAEEQLEMRSW